MKKIKLMMLSCVAALVLIFSGGVMADAWNMPGVSLVEEPSADVAAPSDDMQDNNAMPAAQDNDAMPESQDKDDAELIELPDAIR